MSDATEKIELLKESTVDQYESVHQLGSVNQRIMKKILDKQMDMLGFWVDIGIRQIELISVKDPQEMLDINIRLMQHFTEKLADEKREILTLVDEARDDYQHWYKSNVAKISDKVHQVTEKAA